MANKLTVKVGADTSELKKGLREANKDIRSFEKTGSTALSGLGDALGINVGKIREMGSAFSGAAAKMAQSAGASKAAIVEISSAMGAVGAAAGVAVAAVVAAWKQMDSQALHYLGTLEGIAMQEGSMAYRQTMKNYVKDLTYGGADNAQRSNNRKEAWARFGAGAGAFFAMAADPTENSLLRTIKKASESLPQIMKEANEQGEKARVLQQEITDAQMRQLELQPKLREIQADINKDMAIMRDTSADVNERKAAHARIEDNIRQKYALQKGDLQIIADNINAINDLSSTRKKDKEAEIAAEVKLVDLTVNEEAEMAALVRYSNALNRSVKGVKATAEEGPSLAQILWKGDKATDKTFSRLLDNDGIAEGLKLAMEDVDIDEIPFEIPFTPIIRAEEWKGMIEGFAGDVASSFGSAIGAALSGDNGAWANFGEDLLANIGGFAQKLGGIMMSIGFAQLHLQESFLTGNPGIAIAAGAALIAAGAALTRLNKAASSGNYGAYATGASYGGGSYSGGSGYTERELNIKVSGSLVASGSSLVAVLDNEANRKNKTT